MVKSHNIQKQNPPVTIATVINQLPAHQNLFGTGGIRGHFGTEPLTVPSLIRLGLAIEHWAHALLGRAPVILLASDTRESTHLLKSALNVGLLSGGSVIYDAHILPTPAVCQLVHNNNTFDLGIIISASHNPYQDNGIKIINGKTGKFTVEDEKQISALFHAQDNTFISHDNPGTIIADYDGAQEYLKNVQRYLPIEFLRGKKIVLDCANGATYKLGKTAFELFGATVITINDMPTGKNINNDCGSLHPEQLQAAVKNHHADIGFAFDGDGDRVIIVTRDGSLKDGDDIMALLSNHPAYASCPSVIGTIMSNQGLAQYLKEQAKTLTRTNVGEKYVLEGLEKNNCLLGGEQNGHVILKDYMNYGDGIFNALRVLECMQLTGNWDMATFTRFPQILINLPITQKKDLASAPFAQIIAHHEAQLNGGRLVVRYSGTELLLRVMVEDPSADNATMVGNSLAQALARALAHI